MNPHYRFTYLLISLLLLTILDPIVESLELTRARLLLEIFFALVVLSSAYAVSKRKHYLLIALCIGIPAIGFSLTSYITEGHNLRVGSAALSAFFFLVIGYRILMDVLRSEKVTLDKISGALCVYLFLGIIWAQFFMIAEGLSPGSFSGENRTFEDFLYYSLITLCTVGYGDIVPLTPPARALASVEALLGQIYLAVLVARLVALHIVHAVQEPRD